ncbi:MAG: Grx4 family monothiol glutaredoxin [Deltaproteobacteria bacterium]|nr:Grx4 family monothiol glutaredoxin [Deltaproteobacteria bacterium]
MAKTDLPPALAARIDGVIGGAETVLFMKGTKQLPQCGFSARVVQILDHLGVPYETVNVLADPDIREGIKVYTDWPTIPQLYYKGRFVGGCDIVSGMLENGELQKLFGTPA